MIRFNERLQRMRDEEGFTLIELMVVVLIIAILIAIAIPTFLGARGRAQDRAAQSSLRNAVTGAKAIYTDNEDYSRADVTSMTAGEPALTFKVDSEDSTDANVISIDPRPAEAAAAPAKSAVWIGAALSANGQKCWFIRDSVAPGTNPGTWFAVSADDASLACAANDAPTTFNAVGGWEKKAGDAKPPP